LAPIGRISQFSSLRIHQPDRFRIRKAKFDQNDAQPRFVLRPTDGDGREGQPGVSFFCKVLSPTPIRLSWSKLNGKFIIKMCFLKDKRWKRIEEWRQIQTAKQCE
jgi:hypothetical protein